MTHLTAARRVDKRKRTVTDLTVKGDTGPAVTVTLTKADAYLLLRVATDILTSGESVIRYKT